MDTIEVQIQKFSYGNVQVLKQIQFTVPEGTFCVLLGQNGAGKSTLLKLMLGEISLDEQGAIRLFGQNVCQFHSWTKISYVPQGGMASYQNFPASVEEIVQANLYTRIGKFRFAGKEEKEMVQQALAGVGMPHHGVQESVKEGIFALAMTHPMVDEMRTMYYENMMDLANIIDAGIAYPETEQLIHDHLDDEVMLTLWLYATFGQSMCSLSDALHVHRRTIQYRLDKIKTVTGLNPRVTLEACTLLLAYVRRRTSVIVPALVEQLERVMMQADRRQIVNS